MKALLISMCKDGQSILLEEQRLTTAYLDLAEAKRYGLVYLPVDMLGLQPFSPVRTRFDPTVRTALVTSTGKVHMEFSKIGI
jgi:hypothetical protein